MAKSKIETQPLTPVQANIVFDAKLNVDDFVEATTSEPANFTPAGIIMHSREWAKLAPILVAKVMPVGFEINFEKIAAYYNARCKTAAAGNQQPPKSLSAGECRKIIISLTRDQLRGAIADLKRNEADEKAKLAKEEAIIILRKYGWTQQKAKRKKKAEKNVESKEDSASTAVPSIKVNETQSTELPAQAAVVPAPAHPTKSDSALPVASEETKPEAPPTQTPIADAEKTRIYVTGYGKPHEQALLKIGGVYDRPQRKWHFPDQASANEAARIMGGK